MNAAELRIGNYFNVKGKSIAIDPVDILIIHQKQIQEREHPYEPIPITEEVLLKCGFELMPWGFVFAGNGFALLLAWNHKGTFWVEIANGTKIYFSYLHQLQNMLQLCRQELTYTP